MNLKRHTTGPASTAFTKATLATGYVGSEHGSNSDTSRTTLAGRETNRLGLVRNASLDQVQSLIPEDSSKFGDSGFGGSDTSSEVEENPVEEETSNAIYKRQMFLKKHGFPLWIPQPNETLSRSYQRQGVSIGDVGIFTPDGGFDFLFNICLPAGHPSNPDELPEGFSCLDLKPADVCKFLAHSSHSHMASPLVQKQGATFECSGSDGAILAMPQGAYHEDLRNIRKFKDYAFIHAKSWYQYANGPCGREISKGELHLVTGCDKTTSWGIAAYSHLQSNIFEDNVTRLSFNVNNEGGDRLCPTYTWDYEGTAEAKAGPEDDELMDPPEVVDSATLQNQCTFVRSFTLALGDDDSQHIPSEARSSAGPSPMHPLVSVSGGTSSPPGRIGSVCGRSRVSISRFTDSVTPAQAAHPATYIVDVLLQQCPKAKVVVVHDNDWCSVIRDSDSDWTSTSQDLRHRILEVFDIIEEENGAVYLQEKMGSSQQLSASSRLSVKLEDEDIPLLEGRKPSFSQLFDSFEISPSDIKSDSPPARSLKALVRNWDDDIKPNVLRKSDENDDDLDDQSNPVLDASFEFTFRQIKNDASFKECSPPLRAFKAVNVDRDDDDGSKPCLDPGKDQARLGLEIDHKDSLWLGAVFLEFVSSQIQKMKNNSYNDAFALPIDCCDDDGVSNTDHDSSQVPCRLDTGDLDKRDRIMRAAFIKVMFQLMKNNAPIEPIPRWSRQGQLSGQVRQGRQSRRGLLA